MAFVLCDSIERCQREWRDVQFTHETSGHGNPVTTDTCAARHVRSGSFTSDELNASSGHCPLCAVSALKCCSAPSAMDGKISGKPKRRSRQTLGTGDLMHGKKVGEVVSIDVKTVDENARSRISSN